MAGLACASWGVADGVLCVGYCAESEESVSDEAEGDLCAEVFLPATALGDSRESSLLADIIGKCIVDGRLVALRQKDPLHL